MAEFVGGLCILRIAMPLESVVLACAGLALTLLGLSGLTKFLSKPVARPYLQEDSPTP